MSVLLGVGPRDAPGEDVGELLNVGSADHELAALVLLAQPVDQLSAEDVDLAVEDAPLVGDLHLLLGQLLDEFLELLIGQRAEVWKRVHYGMVLPYGRGSRCGQYTAGALRVKLNLR